MWKALSENKKFSYLIGVRNRSNKNLLSSQETQGNYVPSSTDLQAQLTYQFSKWSGRTFWKYFSNKIFPAAFVQPAVHISLFSLFHRQPRFDIFFEGYEKDEYTTNMIGLSLINQVNRKLKLKWMASRFENDEKENVDITGAYLFGERDFDKSKPTFGTIVNPLGAGVYQNFSRNNLNIENWNFSHKGNYDRGKHVFQWGLGYDKTLINDKLNEWEFQDSAGYSLPYNPDMLQLSKVLKSTADLDINKFSGYVQDNIRFGDSLNLYTVICRCSFQL